MNTSQPDDLINISEARRLLGVSRFKMAELIKNSHLRCFPNILDKRVKLVSRAEVLAIKPRRAEAA